MFSFATSRAVRRLAVPIGVFGIWALSSAAWAASGLVAGYGFSEGSGTMTADTSGNAIAGTLVNGPGWTTGRNGGGLAFNGSSTYVDLGKPVPLQITGSMTVSAWVYETANVADDATIVSKSDSASGWHLKSTPDTGLRTFGFAITNTSGALVQRYSSTVRALNTWYHVAGVYDASAGTMAIYVNGNLANGVLSGTVPSSQRNSTVSAKIGRRTDGFTMAGIVDDVRVYARALTQAEIQGDMTTPVGGTTLPDTTPPSTPTALAATAVSSSQVNLSWAASSDNVGVAGYRVYRTGVLIGSSTTLLYSDSSLSPSTPYSHTVSAYDLAGNTSASSAPASATTPPVSFDFALGNPGSLSVARGSTAATTVTATLSAGSATAVSFTAAGLPSGVTASFSPGSCSPSCATGLTLTAAASSPLGTSITTVTAVGGGVTRTTSFSLTVTSGPDTTAPTATLSTPSANATVAGSSVTVGATAADNVGVAALQFLLDGASLGAEDTTSPYSTAWNSTLAADGPHQLSARARDAAGNFATAAAVNVIVDNQAPVGAIEINGGGAATKSTTVSLALTATDALSAVSQMRFSNTGSSFSTPVAFAPTATWTLSSGAGTKTVSVQFKDAAGNWSPSFTDTIVLDTTAPTISSTAASGVTGGSAAITWLTNEPATSQVEYGPSTSYGLLTTRDPALVTSHRIVLGGLAASTRYYFRARSLDAAGNEGIGSRLSFTTTNVTDTTPPSVPAGVSATGTSVSRLDVRWAASSDNIGVSGYRVYRNGALAGTAATTSFGDTGLTPNTTYAYSVAAYDAAGNASAASSPVSGDTLPDVSAPSIATNLTATAVSARRIDLTWNASTDDVGVSGYDVYRDGTRAAVVNGTSWSDTDLEPASGHEYGIAAFDAAGNVSATSPPASATTLAAVAVAPASVTVAGGSTTPVSCMVDDPVDTSCTWSVAEGASGGTVSATGPTSASYTAPGTLGTYHLVATSVADPTRSATATVTVVAGGTPTLIQHASSAANEWNQYPDLANNNYKLRLPNAVGSGNGLVLFVTYDKDLTVSVSDNINGGWGSAITTATGNLYRSSAFVYPNTGSGLITLTLHFSGGNRMFQFELGEWSNLATISPVSGSTSATGDRGEALACGSFTPTDNNANGGNLVLAYYGLSDICTDHPTAITKGSGFTLLSADITAINNDVFPHALQYQVQTSSAAINPGITFTGDTGNYFNCVAISLKAANAGTPQPAGIRIKKFTSQTTRTTSAGDIKMQLPTTGNDTVLIIHEHPYVDLSGITDSKGNTYTRRGPADGTNVYHTTNSTPAEDLVITFHFNTRCDRFTIMAFDIENASTSPFDNVAGLDNVSLQGQSVWNDAPTLTPNYANGLTIAFSAYGLGPAWGFNTGYPASANFITTTYDNKTDADWLDNASGLAVLYHTSTATQHWNWDMETQSQNTGWATAIAFKKK